MFKNKYVAIACVNNKNVIAKEGKLLFHIKADLENFRTLTSGNVVIMGRKTFEALPDKPLKDRINIILTTDENYKIDSNDEERFKDCYVCNTIGDVDDLCYSLFSDKKLFVIGGGEIFSQYYDLGLFDEAILTVVNDDQDGEVVFPNIQENPNYRVIFKTMSLRDHPNDNYYRYVIYKKND